MDENLHDIDKVFRDPIEEHEDMPSARVWETIDANLDKSNIVSIKKKYDNLKKIAIVLLLLLLGGVIYEIQTKKTGDKNIAVNNTETEKKNNAEKNNANSNNPAGITTNDKSAKQSVSWSDSLTNNFTTNNATKKMDDKTATKHDNSINKTEKEKATEHKGETGTNDDLISGVNKENKVEKVNNASGGNRIGRVNKVNKNKQSEKENVQTDVNRTAVYNNKTKKKISVAKTKIRLQNATVEEPTDATVQQGVDDNENNTVTNNLIKPENTQVEKIVAAPWENNSRLKRITEERISPDTKLKNSIRMPRPFHFSLTPFVSPQFSFNRMEDDHHDPGPQPRNNREQIKKEEQHQSSSSVGVLVDIPFGKKWGLQSGITYVNQETSMEPKKIFAKMDTDGKVKYRFDCSSGYTYISLKTGTAATPVVGDSVTAAASSNTLKYIGIPLALHYTINLGKFSIVPTFGAVANFLVKQRIETEIMQSGSNEKQTINSIQGLKPGYFNAYSGIAFEYNLNKRIAFSVMPAGNIALSSINKDAAVKSYPNSFAVTGGVKIKF